MDHEPYARSTEHDRVAVYRHPPYRAYSTPIRIGAEVPPTYTAADGTVMTVYVVETIDTDDTNRHLLHEYAAFLYNEMPGRSSNPAVDMWGSHEAVANQITKQRNAHADAMQGGAS